ncbi:hypothetical protein HOA91_05700 [Candidatus Woesearchaeota archaeon]|jgi:hypothetical protein|nr:hypothetical protein [Candidatus Woesearchaeota archaeon]
MVTRLTDEVLKFDNKNIRNRSSEENEYMVSELLGIVNRYVHNGSVPNKHCVVYGLRVAGELAGDLVEENNICSKIMLIAEDYNQRVGRGDRINEINFYGEVPCGNSALGGALSRLEVKETLNLKGVEYLD